MADLLTGSTAHEHLHRLVTLWEVRDLVDAQRRSPDREALRRTAIAQAAADIQSATGDTTKLRAAILKAAGQVFQAVSEDAALEVLSRQFAQLETSIPRTPVSEALQVLQSRERALRDREQHARAHEAELTLELQRVENEADELRRAAAAAGGPAAKA